MAVRSAWLAARKGHPVPTQMRYAREGTVTEEMRFVAEREGLAPEYVRAEVARGRMIIPVGDLDAQHLFLLRKRGAKLERESVLPVRFVPMTGVGGKSTP